MQGASEQCMQATEIDFSAAATPSLMVTTRRRLTPQGTSFSCLQAVTQPLHSMHRSASHKNFIRAMVCPLSLFDLAKRRLGFLHHRYAVVAIGRRGIDGLAAHERRRTLGVVLQHVLPLPPTGEVERNEARVGADALGNVSLHLESCARWCAHPDEFAVAYATIGSGLGIDLDVAILLQLG